MWLLLLLLLGLTDLIRTADVPCFAVEKENGFVCMCNATHCDTVEPPAKLEQGQFHIYSTSKKVPGFNHRVGSFRMQAFTPHGIKVEIKADRKRQTIIGFGGAFSDSAGYVINSLSSNAQNNLIRSYFSPEGIEYSFCRVVLGSSDFAVRQYTYVKEYDPSLKSFKLTEDDYKYKIAMIQKANSVSKREIKLMGSAWSAPAWMKRRNLIENDYLKPKFRQTWANYLVKTFDAFKENDIQFWGLSTGNEPITLVGYKDVAIDNMAMLPEEQRDWIVNNLGPALEKAGYGNKSIITLDDMRNYAQWWMETIMRTETSRKYVDGVGLHWYSDSFFGPETMDEIHNKFPDKEILYTESSVNVVVSIMLQLENNTLPKNESLQQLQVPPQLGSWRIASVYISSIIENLSHWVTAYMDWNIALNLEGGPSLINFTCDAPVIVNAESDEFYKQPMFYALGHFSKFLQPGAIILESDMKSSPPAGYTTMRPFIPLFLLYKEVKCITALNPDGSYSVFIYNPYNIEMEISVHDPNRGYAFLILEPESLTTLVY